MRGALCMCMCCMFMGCVLAVRCACALCTFALCIVHVVVLACMCGFVLQMPYTAAMKHKLIVLDIAANAAAGIVKRRPLLGVLYDELVRKEWEVSMRLRFLMLCACLCVSACCQDKAGKLGASFDLAVEASTKSAVVLKRAEDLHDTLFASVSVAAPGRATGGSASASSFQPRVQVAVICVRVDAVCFSCAVRSGCGCRSWWRAAEEASARANAYGHAQESAPAGQVDHEVLPVSFVLSVVVCALCCVASLRWSGASKRGTP